MERWAPCLDTMICSNYLVRNRGSSRPGGALWVFLEFDKNITISGGVDALLIRRTGR